MHRHVRRVGDQMALRVKHGTREIQPLLDVDRLGCVLQRDAHLLGDGHEQVVKDFEQNRIGLGADSEPARLLGLGALEDDVVAGGEGRPASRVR